MRLVPLVGLAWLVCDLNLAAAKPDCGTCQALVKKFDEV